MSREFYCGFRIESFDSITYHTILPRLYDCGMIASELVVSTKVSEIKDKIDEWVKTYEL